MTSTQIALGVNIQALLKITAEIRRDARHMTNAQASLIIEADSDLIEALMIEANVRNGDRHAAI